MSRIKLLAAILSKPKYLLILIAVGLLVFFLFGNLAGLLQNPFFVSKRAIPANQGDYFFLMLDSALSGLLFAAIIYKIEELKQGLGKESIGAGGSIIGYLAIACPSCNLLFFSLIGLQANLIALYPFQLEIRALSIIVLMIALFFALGENKCPAGIAKKAKIKDSNRKPRIKQE